MYRNPFSSPCIKIINDILTKITKVRATVIYMTPAQFQLDRIGHLGAIVFTHIHTFTHTHNEHTYINHSKITKNEFKIP